MSGGRKRDVLEDSGYTIFELWTRQPAVACCLKLVIFLQNT
jgi:hypothetical protein